MNNVLRKGIRDAIKNDRDYEIIQLRLKDIKLDDVGKEFDITRERVRQLELRGKVAVIEYMEDNYKEDVLSSYFKHNQYIDQEKIVNDIGEDMWKIVLYSYETKNRKTKTKLSYSEYLKTITVYDNNEFNKTLEESINSCETTITTDVLNKIQKDLESKNYKLNKSLIKNALKAMGYDFYGDYTLKQNVNLGESIRNEVKYKYPNGICTSSKEDIEDLRDTIDIIYRHYDIKEKNIISRIQQSLFLWDASTYTHEDNMHISEDLETDIIEYIECMHEQGIDRILYKKIFDVFEEELRENSNFKNYHSLHGHLTRLSREGKVDFICIKFYVCKEGTENNKSRNYFEDVVKYLADKTDGATKNEILEALPHFDKNMLRYVSVYYPEIVRWNSGKYLNLKSIKVSEEDEKEMKRILDESIENKFNYTSKYIIYKHYEEDNPKLLERLSCTNDKNKLFDLNKFLFEEYYVFNQPHILTKKFPDAENFTSEAFAKYLVNNNYAKDMKDAFKKVIAIYKNHIDIKDIVKLK